MSNAIAMPKINTSAVYTRNGAVKNVIRPIRNKLTIKAYSPDGIELPDQKQTIWNSPAGEYFPELPAIVIITPDKDKALPQDDAGITKVCNAFDEPVIVDGKAFHRGFAWGSAVKTGSTLALETDYFADKGILTFVEDTYRMMRAYYPNSTAGVRGKMRVLKVKIGTVIPGVGPVEDGFGYIRKSITNMMSTNFNKVNMGAWQSSFSFLHRYSLTQELFNELLPHFSENLAELANQSFDFKSDALTLDMGKKAKFIASNPAMKEHPYIANALSEALGERMFRVATTGGFMMQGGVFVPTTSKKLVVHERFGLSKKFIITRYPIDGWGSIRSIESEQTGPESERISNMEVLQYTLTDHFNSTYKGMLGIVDDSLFPEEYDLIVCVDDEKLNRTWKTPEDVVRVEGGIVLEDAVLSVTQWFMAGSAMGVPHGLAKDLNADYDGDQGAVVPGDDFPEMQRQTEAFPKDANPKLLKVKTPLTPGTSRSFKALISMANLVGRATNTLSTVLSVIDQEFIAQEIGFKSSAEMHEFFMYAIKVGTDIFKTSVDYRPIETKLARISTRLGKIKVYAPWTKWIRSEIAFRHEMPYVGLPKRDEQNEFRKRNFILPEEEAVNRQDAIIPQLLRWILPQMDLPESSPVKPLVFYRDWAMEPANDEEYSLGKSLLEKYAVRVGSANLSDPKKWAEFENEWKAALQFVCDQKGISRSRLANILWYISHSDQRMSQMKKMASAVFVGLFEEAEEIVATQPGLAVRKTRNTSEVAVTGLLRQLPTAQAGQKLAVKVVEFTDTRSGEKVTRQALVAVAPVTGQKQPDLPHYPTNMLGLLAVQEIMPVGEYQAVLNFVPGKKSGGTWKAMLV